MMKTGWQPQFGFLLNGPITFQPAEKTFSWLYVGGGLPPVTAKLAKHIQDSQFIKMVELLPEVLRGLTPYDYD